MLFQMKVFISISELKFTVEIFDFEMHHVRKGSEVSSELPILNNIYF